MNDIDVKRLGKVAVLMGGDSAERPVSIMSGSTTRSFARSNVSRTAPMRLSQLQCPVSTGVTASRTALAAALFGVS